MTHDPLCPMWKLVHAESERVRAMNTAGVPIAQSRYEGDDPFQTGEVDNYCQCALIGKAHEVMLAKCVTAIEACGGAYGYGYYEGEATIDWALEALRALQRSKS